MRILRTLAGAAAALGAVACVVGVVDDRPRPAAGSRLELLEEAVRVREEDPGAAASLAARAGAGAVLEQYRLELWLNALQQSGADSKSWERLLVERLPLATEREALLELGRTLRREGKIEAARARLEDASAAGSLDADMLLLEDSNPHVARRAARRLAVRHPRRLRRAGSSLEKPVLSALTPAERLLRAQAWRRAGYPRTAARELDRLRWRGRLDLLRREEAARSWLAAGNPRRALARLPGLSRSSPAALRLRAEAERRLAWSLVPRPSSRRHFARSLTAARRCAAHRKTPPDLRLQALEIVLETATETGHLEVAWAAWRDLAAAGWHGSRRGWLGRRLGVALAQREGRSDRVRLLAAELPAHARCLRYWSAVADPDGRGALRKLAATAPGDLYARWSREDLGVQGNAVVDLGPPAGLGVAPEPVRLLLEWGDAAGARREWRRLRSIRGATPAEGMAAAALEASGPRKEEAIRWLRVTIPCLGQADLSGCPEDAVRAYLPLRWKPSVTAAAAEAGVQPFVLAALARQESTFNALARSSRGAVGVVQLIPSTARPHGVALGLGNNPDLRDPRVNLRVGARELARLLEVFGAVEPALAAYNAGESRVRRWWKAWPDRRRFTEAIPIPETYTYVRRVTYLAEAYRAVWGAELANTVPPQGQPAARGTRSAGRPE